MSQAPPNCPSTLHRVTHSQAASRIEFSRPLGPLSQPKSVYSHQVIPPSLQGLPHGTPSWQGPSPPHPGAHLREPRWLPFSFNWSRMGRCTPVEPQEEEVGWAPHPCPRLHPPSPRGISPPGPSLLVGQPHKPLPTPQEGLCSTQELLQGCGLLWPPKGSADSMGPGRGSGPAALSPQSFIALRPPSVDSLNAAQHGGVSTQQGSSDHCPWTARGHWAPRVGSENWGQAGVDGWCSLDSMSGPHPRAASTPLPWHLGPSCTAAHTAQDQTMTRPHPRKRLCVRSLL